MEQQKHHAIVFEGDRSAALKQARAYTQKTIQIALDANPDVNIVDTNRFTVGDARTLKERAIQTPLGSAQVFIISCDKILREAQNALLKLLEEPADNTHFILIVPTVEELLPTVRSRLAYQGRIIDELTEQKFAIAFLKAPINERMAMIEPLLNSKLKPEEKLQARARARSIVDALEAMLHRGGVETHTNALREIAFVRQYLADTASSLKMLLHHLAVTL